MTRVQNTQKPLVLVRTDASVSDSATAEEVAAFAHNTEELAAALKKRAPVDLDDLAAMMGSD